LRLFPFYWCFRSTSINATPTTTIRIANAATAGRKYCSTVLTGACVGAIVAWAAVTLITLSACEPQ
jgi:hypothetical protein